MKKILLGLLLLSGCVSFDVDTASGQFELCDQLCRGNPNVKAYSDHGGLFPFHGGYKCECMKDKKNKN